LELDHLVPRGKGGKNNAKNAHLLCNYRHPAGNNCHGVKHGQPEWGVTGGD
jgi:hypothetical protein